MLYPVAANINHRNQLKNESKKMKEIFVIIALLLMGMSAQSQTHSHSGHTGYQQPIHIEVSAPIIEHETIKVDGKCNMCKVRIEKAAMGVKGVSAAHWNEKSKDLHLTFDLARTDINVISKSIAKVGHDTKNKKARNKKYMALPDCCKYRSLKNIN